MKNIKVAAAIIKEGNKVFGAQKGYGPFEGGWEFPGGKLEPGENSKQALCREIKEELDTEIEVGDLFFIVEYDYPRFHLTMDCFLCEVKKGKLQTNEHKMSKWFTKETIDSVEWLPANLELVEKLKEIL